jgi:anti-sigma factor ChrR (cupin superfamily)
MDQIMNFDGVTTTNWKKQASKEVAAGIYERIVWQGEKGKRAVVYEFSSGAKFPGLDTHEIGPEQIYVISGTFNDGREDHEEGTFIHNPIGSSHVPQSKEGCVVLVTYPEG